MRTSTVTRLEINKEISVDTSQFPLTYLFCFISLTADIKYAKNSTAYITLHTDIQSSGCILQDIHTTATQSNNSNTQTIPNLWKVGIGFIYIFIRPVVVS